ncbi:MAG: DUF3299 domain-containing protein [Gammaproteobacteria bacterium]
MNKLITIAVLGLSLVATTVSAAPAKPQELSWDDLMPAVSAPPPPAFPGSGIPGKGRSNEVPDSPYVPQYSSNPVKSLDGKFVKLPGFIVPLESDDGGELSEFLLVPYFGACIHVPPPPPNQIVYVKLKKPFNLRSMGDPYWVTGVISTKPWTGDMADTDYVMAGDKVEIFEWKD